jgi:hypothetical protein
LAERISAALERDVPVEGRELCLTVSMGIPLYPQDGTDAQALIRNADTALYRVRDGAGTGVHPPDRRKRLHRRAGQPGAASGLPPGSDMGQGWPSVRIAVNVSARIETDKVDRFGWSLCRYERARQRRFSKKRVASTDS